MSNQKRKGVIRHPAGWKKASKPEEVVGLPGDAVLLSRNIAIELGTQQQPVVKPAKMKITRVEDPDDLCNK